MADIALPRLSESMETATILRWLKRDGEHVMAGDELVELETDKATMTLASEVTGRLEIIASEGATLEPGAVIARAHAQDPDHESDELSPPARAAVDPPSAPDAFSPAARKRADGVGNGAGVEPYVVTPLARRAAKAHGVDLRPLKGTGPRGRITRSDVFAAAGISPPTSPQPPLMPDQNEPLRSSVELSQPGVGFESEQPTRIQRLIATRMSEARSTIPEFEVQTEVTVDEALALRAQLRKLAQGGPIPSFNDFVIKACAMALRRHPRVNASYEDGAFRLHRHVNVAFAVATDAPALIVPVVFDADQKSLSTIAEETRRLAANVRGRTITASELSGATFTVSNLGMFGMTVIRPVINPPQAAILGVGSIRPVLMRAGDQIIDRNVVALTLSCDHRILYGADAARFLTSIKEILEAPLGLVL